MTTMQLDCNETTKRRALTDCVRVVLVLFSIDFGQVLDGRRERERLIQQTPADGSCKEF